MEHFVTNFTQTREIVVLALQSKLVPLVLGAPGEAKSSMARSIAEEFNLEYVDIRLTQKEPQDLNGFPEIRNGRASYVPMDDIPLEGDPLPQGKQGWLINFDELTSAHAQIQAAAYKILLDRKVGRHNIHSKCLMLGCGNQLENNAIVEEMSTALISRLAIVNCKLGWEEWVDWAQSAGVPWEVCAFVSYMPTRFNTFNPESREPYACARTWHFAGNYLGPLQRASKDTRVKALATVLGMGVASEFAAFLDHCANLPKLSEIEAAPATAYVPREASHRYAVTGMLIGHTNDMNFPAVMQYMERMTPELQVIYLRQVIAKVPSIKRKPAFITWATRMGTALATN